MRTTCISTGQTGLCIVSTSVLLMADSSCSSSVCGGSATGSATGGVEADGDNSSSGDEESGDADEETREREDSHSQQVTVPSVLEVLRAPQPSALNRKRKVLSNRGRGGKRRRSSASSSTSSEPKKVTPLQRVKEFPGEKVVVSRGKLVCSACREELHVKSSTVKNHIRSTKHVDAKKLLSTKEAREQDIAIALKAHNSTDHLVSLSGQSCNCVP